MAEPQDRRVAFLGVHNWRAHEVLRWWSAAYGQGERAAAKGGARGRLDVFGVARPDVAPLPTRGLVWLGLRPGSDTRVAAQPSVHAVVCSGQGPNDVQVVKDCRRAGKVVFVESLERFQPADLADLAAAAKRQGNTTEGSTSPHLMTGLYLRFDSALQEVVDMGLESMVGRPLLFQAHASTLAPSLAEPGESGSAGSIPWFSRMHPSPVIPSLFELGMQHVDALRYLLKTEPTEVFAAGTPSANAAAEGTPLDFGTCDVVSLTIKTSSGTLAVVSLDCSGGTTHQRILVVGDQSRVELVGKMAAGALQTAGIRHFMAAATAGAPPRMTAGDCLCTATVMAAARESLRTGAPVPVSYGIHRSANVAAAPAPAGGISCGIVTAADTVGSKAGRALEGARQLVESAIGAESPPGKQQQQQEQEGVGTPPHQRMSATKPAPSTPESPLLPTIQRPQA